MLILYLYTVQNLNCYLDDRNFAIISEETLDTLEELNEGDTTNFFNESKIEKDIVKFKKILPFLNEIFNKIISNYKKNLRICVEKENNNFWCIIDNEKFYIGNYSCEKGYIIFDYVSIYSYKL